MASTSGALRLAKEAAMLEREPTPLIKARPSPDDVYTFHYAIEGPPDTPYQGGVYHGVLIFPREYPFKPPRIQMWTPSGRFEVKRDLCLTVSSFHPETWKPSWSARTVLLGLQSFMAEAAGTAGSVESTLGEKRSHAKRSLAYNMQEKMFVKLFPEYAAKHEEALAAAASEAKAAFSSVGSEGEAAEAVEEPTTVGAATRTSGTAATAGSLRQTIILLLGLIAALVAVAWQKRA